METGDAAGGVLQAIAQHVVVGLAEQGIEDPVGQGEGGDEQQIATGAVDDPHELVEIPWPLRGEKPANSAASGCMGLVWVNHLRVAPTSAGAAQICSNTCR